MSFFKSILNRTGSREIAAIAVILLLVIWAFNLVADPLRKVPGPFLTRFTKFWLVRQYIKGDFHKTNIELHEKYGPLVRLAPDFYSVDDPGASKIIYGHGTHFTKSTWYLPWGTPGPEGRNLFNDINPVTHTNFRRKVAGAYTMSSLVSYEPFVDECTAVFMQRLSEFASSGVVFNMGHWFQCYAAESIGKITFSKRLGFLDSGEDVKGIMEALEVGGFMGSVLGLFPWLNPILMYLIIKFAPKGKGPGFVDEYANQLIESRRNEKIINDDGPSDFIGKFMAIRNENPEKMKDKDIRNSAFANIAAGSDTTSITLSGILYHLLKNPRTMEKLRRELDDATDKGTISDPIAFQEAQALPYVQAVIKEGLRFHPAVGFTMPRVVPKGGRDIMGWKFPAGVTIGINPWVAHRNRAVFGNDADLFVPERWLEGKESSSGREAYFLSFGQGARTCIGKNISLLEISKTIPQVVRHFDIEMENLDEWTVATHWFAKPKDFECRVRRRIVQEALDVSCVRTTV